MIRTADSFYYGFVRPVRGMDHQSGQLSSGERFESAGAIQRSRRLKVEECVAAACALTRSFFRDSDHASDPPRLYDRKNMSGIPGCLERFGPGPQVSGSFIENHHLVPDDITPPGAGTDGDILVVLNCHHLVAALAQRPGGCLRR